MNYEENTSSAGGTGIRPPKPMVIENGGTGNASTWKLWIQQFGWYATATGLDKRPPEIQVAMFMSAIGPEAAVIYNTFGLTDNESQSLETIKKKFEEYFIPKTNVTYERYIFNQMVQNNEESFDEFLTKLKNKIRNCDYEKLEDSILRDRIVIGIKSKTTRERLLIENDLNLQKAVDICRAAEQLKLQMNKIDNNSEITPTVTIGLEATTNEVIKKLKDAGLKLNPDKCVLNTQEIRFLGHIFANNGLKPDPEKLETINKIKRPENVKELQRFLGLITYLSKFIQNLSHITNPLRQLLQKDIEWYWDNPQEEAFKQLKQLLKSPPVLGFYKPEDPILLSVDASSYACGGVLMQNGKPIAYCAKAFTKTEQGYSQLEKEANAILVACKKFHTYIWGCKDLTIESDHKPLETIFKKTLSEAPPRLQRMLYQILPYNAKIIYKRGQELFIADTLSRDCRELSSQDMNEDKIQICAIMPFSKNRKQELKYETEKSIELRKLKEIILNGWPDDIKLLPEEIKKYWYYREQLSVYDHMIFKNNRILIPQSMVPIILKHCHLSHKSTVGTLQLARDNVFWPNMSSDVQDYVRRCQTCLKTQKDKPMETILLQEVPKLPWSVVASDIFHHKGKNFIAIADAYSGYFDFHELSNLNSSTVIKSMKIWFSSFGIPEFLLTDNGRQYDSEQFKEFSNQWQFQHRLSSPHFPRSNGLAERYVQEAKNLLKKCLDENSDVQLALLHHRNTPREKLGSPVQRLMGRRTKTLLPINSKLLKPKIITNIENNLKAAKQKEKKYADKGKEQGETFDSGEQVMLREDHRHWVPAKIIAPTLEPRSYLVEKPDGSIYRRNTWHLRSLPPIPSHNKPVLVSDNLNNVLEEPSFEETLKNLNMMVSSEQAESNKVPPTEQSPLMTAPEPPPKSALPLRLPETQPLLDPGLSLPKTTRSGRPVILPKRYA